MRLCVLAACILQQAVSTDAFAGVPATGLFRRPGVTCARVSLLSLKAQITGLPTPASFTTLSNAKLRKVWASGRGQ